MNPDGPSAGNPVLQIFSRWGVSSPVKIVALPAFQTWTGQASRWRGRLGDGREVLIEVQDTVAEPWFEFDGGENVVDLRDEADAIVGDVGDGAGGLPSGLIPWLRVEHDRTRALLLWMREYSEGEVVGIPSATPSPWLLLASLQPVAEAVDWANRNLLHGICASPDLLVWSGGRVRVADWGKEAFDWLLDSRNAETRIEPEMKLMTGIRAGRRSLPPHPWWPKGDRSVASFVRTWLDLRLGESQVSFMDELDTLAVHERGVLLKWLKSESSASSAADFLRELRSLSEDHRHDRAAAHAPAEVEPLSTRVSAVTRVWAVTSNGDRGRAAAVVVADERYAPLRAFFWSAREGDYAAVIEAALLGVGSSFDDVGVTFPGDLDLCDKPFAPDEVEVYDALAAVRMPRQEFLEVLLAATEAVLNQNRERQHLAPSEELELRSAAAKLDALISREKKWSPG